MNRDEKFAAAVKMAEGFIINGDIRFDKAQPGSNSMMMLHDMITTLYKVIDDADMCIDSGD